MQLRNTTGQLGYALPNATKNNMYTILGNDDNTDSTGTVATQVTTTKQTVAMTAGSTLGSTYTSTTVPAEIAAAIN